VAGGAELERTERLFLGASTQAGRPDDLALFIRHQAEGRLHCEVEVYFPPAAAGVARAVDAMPCRRPAIDGRGLLAGAETAWRRLIPGTNG
jgi:hypothetical protein